jgi:hypothetical protein
MKLAGIKEYHTLFGAGAQRKAQKDNISAMQYRIFNSVQQ